MGASVYITGSSGVLGFEILEKMSEWASGRSRVVGVARRELPLRESELEQIVTPTVLVPDWLDDADNDATVVHCAGLANPRVPFSSYSDLNTREIVPHVEMVEQMLARGWKGHLVYISSGGAIYGDTDRLPISEEETPKPKSFYALQKVSVENALVFLSNQHGFRLTILRVSNPYGSRVPKKGQGVLPILIDAALNETEFTVFGTGEELRDYLHISDFRTAVERVCAGPMPGLINKLNIGSGTGTSLNQLIEMISTLTGRDLKTRQQSTNLDVKSNVLKIDRAKSLLNWAPRVRIEQGVGMMIEDFAAAPAVEARAGGR